LYGQEKKKVLLVDADPTGNLASALGYTKSNIIPISEMKELIEERTKINTLGGIFKLNPEVDDIPEKFSLELQGIRLLVMGGIKKGGGGCACPQNVLIKNLIANLLVKGDEVVIMDMEAGIEHLGRATAKTVQAMIIVVEPGMRSINIAYQVNQLAADIGIEKIFVVGNKIRGLGDSNLIKDKIPNIPILGFISYNDELIEADMGGTPVFNNKKTEYEVGNIKKRLEEII
jgi:CO dehydrogenase maturation factor